VYELHHDPEVPSAVEYLCMLRAEHLSKTNDCLFLQGLEETMPAHSAEDLPMFYACMHFHSINGGRVDLGKLVDKWHSMFPLAAQSMTGITIDGYTSEREKVVLAEALKGCRDGYKAFTVTLDDAKLLVVPSRGSMWR